MNENENGLPFTGNNQLTRVLQDRLRELHDNFNPFAVRPSLNNRQFEDAIAELGRFSGNFVYVYAKSGSSYSIFLVRDGGLHYVVDVAADQINFDWWTVNQL